MNADALACYIPMAIAVFAVLVSIYSVIRDPSVAQILFTLPVLIGMGVSFQILLRMARGAWPTYIPFMVIFPLLAVPVGQVLVARRRRAA